MDGGRMPVDPAIALIRLKLLTPKAPYAYAAVAVPVRSSSPLKPWAHVRLAPRT
jgi:hypothetical protein